MIDFEDEGGGFWLEETGLSGYLRSLKPSEIEGLKPIPIGPTTGWQIIGPWSPDCLIIVMILAYRAKFGTRFRLDLAKNVNPRHITFFDCVLRHARFTLRIVKPRYRKPLRYKTWMLLRSICDKMLRELDKTGGFVRWMNKECPFEWIESLLRDPKSLKRILYPKQSKKRKKKRRSRLYKTLKDLGNSQGFRD